MRADFSKNEGLTLMLKTYSCLLVGVDVVTLEIETVIGSGFSGLSILGLSAEATRDMRERVRSALESIGIQIPARRIVVNITPSELTKISRLSLSQLDFAVAASIIYALHQENQNSAPLFFPEKQYLAGELSLSGELKELQNPIIYQSILLNSEINPSLCLPVFAKEYLSVSIQHKIEFFGNLKDWYNSRKEIKNPELLKINLSNSDKINSQIADNINNSSVTEFLERVSEVESIIAILLKNPRICVALLVAALGQHHILIAGEPGVGKSFALQKILKLLNPLTEREKLDIKLIHSVVEDVARPLRCPHHSATPAALIGGSSLKPGEVSLAHCGVLFLDELAEFSSSSLESLREPLDAKQVFLSRAGGNIRYPANFQLCATTNPCACGFLFSNKKACRCHPRESRKYLQKISGPLLDRFCLQVWAEPYQPEVDLKDPFVQHLNNIFTNGNLSYFSRHFLRIMNLGSKELGLEFDRFTAMNFLQNNVDFNSCSLRGQEKIINLVSSFNLLFPELGIDEKIINSIMNYRILDKIFSQRNIF